MLKRTFTAAIALLALSTVSVSALAAKGDTHVQLTTSAGNIELELNNPKAPVSVKNFVNYVNKEFYNNTIFHRVILGFMVQGGGFTADMQQKQTNAPIKNEADNGLRNLRGTTFRWRVPQRKTARPASSFSTLLTTPSSITASAILATRFLVKL